MADPEQKRQMHPERVLACGFLALILVGGILLALPIAAVSGKSIGLFEGMFTATSAVCVTGLIVVDTGTTFSLFGQVVLLVLIQLGGLGFMLFATLTMMAMGRRITLQNRLLIRDSMNASTMTGLPRLAGWISLLTVGIELLGAMLLAVRFVPAYGWGKGLFFSLFHSVSAFCNAGFDLMGGYASLTGYWNDPLVLLTIAMLITLGGMGFAVMMEVVQHKGKWRELSLHAKIVLTVSTGLLAVGTLFYALVEWNNPVTLAVEEAHAGTKLLGAFFQSVTMRTAGFNSVDLAGMTDASKLMSVLLMFIGASPASTGGGVKTTTISVLLLIVFSVVKGQENVNVFGKRLPTDLMRRAVAILFITLIVLLCGTMGLTLLEKGAAMSDILFETTSAMATVGVSSLGTPTLSRASQVILIPMMFFGRVGPLTMAMALASKMEKGQNKIKYPEEKIMIG